jgi:thiamine biosynthesis lipoprotein
LITPQADAGMLSDAASKPLFIGGPTDWLRLARKLGVSHALRVDADGRITATSDLQKRLELEPGVKIDVVAD